MVIPLAYTNVETNITYTLITNANSKLAFVPTTILKTEIGTNYFLAFHPEANNTNVTAIGGFRVAGK